MKNWFRTKPKGHASGAGLSHAAKAAVEARSSEARFSKGRWIGFVDRIERSVAHGWCMDRENPMARSAVEAVGSGGGHAVTIADVFRQDLEEGGYGDGRHGFELDLGAFAQDESVTIRFADGGREISRAPIALDPVAALLSGSLPHEFLQAARSLARRIEVACLALRGSDAGAPASEEPLAEFWDHRLNATFDPARDPEGLVTRFMAHEASRLGCNVIDAATTGSLQGRLGILLWYVDTYAATRPSDARLPLGEDQIAALNAPAHLAGASDAVTVALFNFVLAHKPTHVELRDDRLLREAVFWWCTRHALRHRLDRRLIVPAHVALLTVAEHGAGSQFPCNAFMALYARDHPELGGLDLGLPRDRVALVVYLHLASFLDPSLSRFIPGGALRGISRGEHERSLASIVGRLIEKGVPRDRASIGADLLGKGEALLAAAGLSSPPRGPPAAPSSRSTTEPGVLVLGPFGKCSGPGRAARLSREVLEACEEQAPLAYDFAMDDPAAEERGGFQPKRNAPPAVSREITILHLDVGVLPLAFAYGPRRLLADTYRIGFFVSDRTGIPECQRLSLDLVDEIWVASEFERETYARATDKPVIRVGMAAPGLPEAPATARETARETWGIAPGAFTFVTVFDALSGVVRRNPMGAIEAFQRAFPAGDASEALVVKTRNRGRIRDARDRDAWRAIDRAIAADPRIVLVDETLAFPDLLALIRACDAYVSLHRSIGWGFGLVEAMQLGLPVVCTGWSGNADFCTDETAFLVAHRLIPVEADAPCDSAWADPSIESAAKQMKIVASDEAAVARTTQAARAFVISQLGLQATARRYADRLGAIRAAKHKAAG